MKQSKDKDDDDDNDKNPEKEKVPSALYIWWTAARPHTLTASLSPVLVGGTLSWIHHGAVPHLLSFGSFAALVQLGTNFHNDYADFVKGADTDQRVGQPRATQRGWLTPFQTATASTTCLAAALAIGLHLSRLSNEWDAVMLTITVSSVFNAVAYTGGPYPLGYLGLGWISIGYAGLGDVFVFVYFGLVATMTLPYLVHQPTLQSFRAAILVACLATAIIVVNNLRDRHTDVKAGKRTLAVRFGPRVSRLQYGVLVLLPQVLLWIPGATPLVLTPKKMGVVVVVARLLPLVVTLPLAIPQLRAVAWGGKDGADLNPHVGGTARLQLVYCLALCASLVLVGAGEEA